MDKIYTDPNIENDNTEHIRKKRLSSILKAPRNPLDDLGNGNEMTQDIHIERHRRSSRRVSFADTINCRVFQRDLKNSTTETEKKKGCSADEKGDTLTNQNEDPGAVPCEITGMNTLLHAPIQALGQQTEWHGVDHTAPRTDRQDTTVLFSEENEMEMTASHTAMISWDLRAHQPGTTEKIDFTSFLAKLNSSQGKAESSKELSLLSDPANHAGPSLEQKEEATTAKKIDFNEFLLRLKSNNPAERPDKENVGCAPSQGLGDVTELSGEFGYSQEPDTCNVTKVFRGREGGMEMTKCEAADVKIPFPGVGEVPPEQWECADVTEAFADEGMDVTTSHTTKVSFALSTVGNQRLNLQKDFPPTELDNSVLRRASNHNLSVQQDPQLCADRKTANAEGRGDLPVLQAGKQEAGALSAIQGSISSETIFRGDRTVVFSKCDDMEMTGNYTDIICNASITEENSSCHKTCEKPVSTNPLLAGSRSLACGDVPRSVAPGDNPAAGPYKISAMELPSASGGHMENMSQAHGPAAASTGFGSHMHLVAGGVLKSRFDPSANPQHVFSGEKTVIFAGEDMDLAKTYVKGDGENVDDEHPTAAFTSVTCKPHFLGNRSMSSNVTEQEEMEITRCHTVFFDGQGSGIKAELKQTPYKMIPRKNQNKNVTEGNISAHSVDMDKENVVVWSIDGNIKKSQAMESNAQDIFMIMDDKKLGKTNFQASGLSSKSMCLLQEQNRGDPENVVTNTSTSLTLQSQEVVSQPVGKHLPSLSDFCTNDTTGVFLGDQSMDITKAHPAAFEIAPIDTEQESNNYNQNTALSKQLQNQPFPFSSRRGVDIVSQTAAMECEDVEMNTNKQIVTALAPSGSFTFSKNLAPSGMRGNEQFGTVIGINAKGQNSERQEEPQPVRAVSKILPTQGDSDRHSSMSKINSLREDLKPPPSAHGLLLRGAEEPVWARTSEAPKESSQLSFFGEKSVVFPHGENMDMTGRCVVMVPEYSINVILPQNKAAPECFDQSGNETTSLGKGATTTTPAELGGQEATGGRTISFAPAEDMEITTAHTARYRQPFPAAPANRTIVFAQDQEDMDITASHTVAVSRNILGLEAQQVPHTNTQQPPQHMHGGLVPCSGEMDSSQYATTPKDKPSIPSSASSDSAFPTEKGAIQVPSGTTPHSIYSVSLQESTMDVETPQDHGLPTDNSVPVGKEQDLTPPEKLQSKGVSIEFPSKGTVDHREESGSVGSCVAFPMQGSDPWKGQPDAPCAQRNQLVEEDSSQCGDSDLGLAEANLIPAANKDSKKNEELSAEGEAPPKDFQINSEQTRQPLVSDSSGDHPTLLPAASGVLGVCSKLMGLTRKSISVSTTSSDQLPSSSAQPEDTLRLGKSTVSEPNNFFDTKKQENTGLESGADPIGMAPKDKYPGINIPLGIFQPKLPNKRNHVSSAQDISTKSDRVEAPVPANTSETPGKKSSRRNFSPFQFIAEQFLPVCLEEMDSNESVSSELMENTWTDKNKKQTPHSENGPFEETETCSRKRSLEEAEEDLQSSKKAKSDQQVDAGASQGLEDQAEVDKAGEPPNLSATSPECPHASTSSSLDSVKADIESTSQRSSQAESQLLTDSICDENLWEKFQNGAITVGEFFTLLQVHVVIQKPRHSQVPASCAVSAPPTAEDLLYSQYIHRPKLRIYEEDCQDLSLKIAELKPHVTVLDQPLVNVIRSLWEVMRTCTDEELSKFGAELNKMKSCFTKEAKILSHNEKEILYRKLLQSAEEQYRKLQSRIEKVDDWMKEAESSVVALESDSFWDEEEAGCSAGTAGGRNLQGELQSITAQEEELLRELSEMDAEDELHLVEMEKLKQTERACLEILKKYDFTEWELMEWSEQQAVFNFLYDSVTLTVVFGPPIDGEFFAERPSRSITSLDFESFLDEEKAPPSSCLVQRLIFRFIESRGSWQDKCPTLHYLPQALFDISLVINRCKILGEELEFLQRWGAKFHLLETDIKNTEVKLLFSSSVAFAKFELTLAVSHDYPAAILPFRVQTHIGNIGEKEIAAVLSKVPAGHHYLQRIVISIHQNLLQGPR